MRGLRRFAVPFIYASLTLFPLVVAIASNLRYADLPGNVA